MNDKMTVYLLSIRGVLNQPNLDAARTIHNETAGAPQSVEVARSLGDLSHMVYVPVGNNGSEAGEFLILDRWNSMDGLNQFFENPQVQEQAGQIFSDRDPVVWLPAPGFDSYHIPAPFGKNDRIVGIVRGQLKSLEEGQHKHNAFVKNLANKARRRGHVSHEAFIRLTPPDEPASTEFFAVDVWMDAAGMNAHYQDPDFTSAFSGLFASPPSADIWVHPSGDWVEW
jgi:quinol monooxygenase YgiN